MARKIKFALEMKDGAKVRSNLEELRENFDLEKAVGYFLSGKLVEWLEDRYYEDEAEKLEAIDKDAPDLRARLCEALGVECEDDAALDVEALERLNEKKAVLRQKTSDEAIIANADKTALTQEDLADLLDMDEPVIYLCGEKFNIPARVKNKKYVGILGTPTVSIKAASQNELDEKGIAFENVKLPWGQTQAKNDDTKACPKCAAQNSTTAKFCSACGAAMNETTGAPKVWSDVEQEIPKDENKAEKLQTMNELFSRTFHCDKWLFLARGCCGSQQIRNANEQQKKMCVKLVCRNKYTVDDIVHMCMDSNFKVGWALTYESFCAGGKTGDWNIKYKDIVSVNTPDNSIIVIQTKTNTFTMNGHKLDSNITWNNDYLEMFLTSAAQFAKLEN